jgi:hypothetical protein
MVDLGDGVVLSGDARADGEAMGEALVNQLIERGGLIEGKVPGAAVERMVHAASEMLSRAYLIFRAAGMNDAKITKAYFDAFASGKQTADLADAMLEREIAAASNDLAVKQ